MVEADLTDVAHWLSEPEVRQFWGDPEENLEEMRAGLTEPDYAPSWQFVIGLDGRGVGVIQYSHREPDPDSHWDASIDIFIGDAAARGRGVGIEAVRVLLRHLFEEKRVHRVTIDPELDNVRAIHVYERAGFRLDGILRHNDRIEGRWVDAQYLTILEDEWPAARARWIDERGTL